MPTATKSPVNFGAPPEVTTDPENSSGDEKGDIKMTNTSSPPKNGEDSKDAYNKILEEAPFIHGNDSPLVPLEEVPWLDLSLIKIAMDWFKDYFAPYTIATIVCMMSAAIATKPLASLIFRTDKPLKPEPFFRRFVGKFRGVERFFLTLLDHDEVQKLLYKTRKLHAMAALRTERVRPGENIKDFLIMKEEQWMRDYMDAVKKDVAETPWVKAKPSLPPQIEEDLSWNSNLPFNQFGMIWLTAGFLAAPWLKPQLFGIKDRNDIKMKALVHFWAVCARLLGLQDEFNIYIKQDHEQIDNVIRDVYVDNLMKIDTMIIYMQSLVAEGIYKHVPIITQATSLALTIQVLGNEKVENLWKVMTFPEKCYYYFIRGAFYLQQRVKLFRQFINKLFKTYMDHLYKEVLDKPNEKYKAD